MTKNILFGIVIIFLWGAAYGHPMHVSIAEAEYNPATQSLEVGLRLSADDYERLISAVVFESDSLDVLRDNQIRHVLAKNIFVNVSDSEPVKLRWVGKELSLAYVWLYFEFPLAVQPGTLRLSNILFFDSEPNQANTLTVKVADKIFSVVCTPQQPEHEIQF